MASLRDAFGRFLRRPLEQLSPAYRRRIENAERREQSRDAARGHAATRGTARDSAELFGSEHYEKSLRVLNRMRGNESLSAAARAEEIRPGTVRRYVGPALERDGNRYRAKSSDRLYRRMEFLTERGYVAVEPATSREATQLAKYHNAVRRYLELDDQVQLAKFAGKSIRLRDGSRLMFVTELDDIDHLASAGVLSFTSIYRNVA